MAEAGVQSNRLEQGPRVLFSPLLRTALILGVCVHLIGFLVFRVVSNPLPSNESGAPFVRYVPPEGFVAGEAFEERAMLFDSAPLFVPGIWNAAHNLKAPSRDRNLFRFASYRPPEEFASTLLPESVPFGKDYGVSAPVDLLTLSSWDLYQGLAQEASIPIVMETTGVFAEVRSMNGQWSRMVPLEMDSSSALATQPAIYYLRMEAGGRALGRPTLSASSGDAAFDAAVYTLLAESGLSADLPAGLYQIAVYP